MYDENESEPLTEPDTSNATKFNPEEAPKDQRDYWKLLAGYNSGVYTRDWADQSKLGEMDKYAVFDSISGIVELSPHQKRRGRMLISYVDARKVGGSLEALAFVMCAFVAREDGRKYHPRRADDNNDQLFLALADDLDLRASTVDSALARLSESLRR